MGCQVTADMPAAGLRDRGVVLVHHIIIVVIVIIEADKTTHRHLIGISHATNMASLLYLPRYLLQ